MGQPAQQVLEYLLVWLGPASIGEIYGIFSLSLTREAEARPRGAGKRPARPVAQQAPKEEPFIRHAKGRLAELRALLLADSNVRVTIAGGNGRSYLGTGLAREQWRRACTDRRDRKAYENFMNALACGIEQLQVEFSSRVTF